MPAEQVKKFKAEMDAAGVNYKVIDYPKTKHAFSRPDADSLAKKFNMPCGLQSRSRPEVLGRNAGVLQYAIPQVILRTKRARNNK